LRNLDAESFARAWRRGELADEAFAVHAGDASQALHLYCWSRPEATPEGVPLVVAFHGAIDRTKREVPAFEGGPLRAALAGRAILIGIADPSLLRDPALRIGWYAGHEGFDVPATIGAVVRRLGDAWQVPRVVFAGGSTGGHPALLQSARLTGSVAVVQNPITRISGYYRGTVEQYRDLCWPTLAPKAALSEATIDDVGVLYGEDLGNTVILLQNARDHHLFGQSATFLQAVRSKRNREALLFLSAYYAEHVGHSFPPGVWSRWVGAAVDAAATDRDAIVTAFRDTQPAKASQAASAPATPAAPPARDLAWNARLLEQTRHEVT
jgi:hypothetical protein